MKFLFYAVLRLWISVHLISIHHQHIYQEIYFLSFSSRWTQIPTTNHQPSPSSPKLHLHLFHQYSCILSFPFDLDLHPHSRAFFNRPFSTPIPIHPFPSPAFPRSKFTLPHPLLNNRDSSRHVTSRLIIQPNNATLYTLHYTTPTKPISQVELNISHTHRSSKAVWIDSAKTYDWSVTIKCWFGRRDPLWNPSEWSVSAVSNKLLQQMLEQFIERISTSKLAPNA